MTAHVDEDRLQDYVDDVLAETERAEVERHVTVCETCAGEVRALRALLGDIATLPRQIAPERNLLPDIHSAIGNGSLGGRTLHSVRPLLAAAAVILVALSSAVTAWLMRERSETDNAPAIATTEHDEFLRSEAHYVSATEDLAAVVRAQKNQLSPETLRIVEQNIAVIDAALQEARDALSADPGNVALSQIVLATYEKKLDLLRRAAEL
jgi:anti-sigma factor RsiW